MYLSKWWCPAMALGTGSARGPFCARIAQDRFAVQKAQTYMKDSVRLMLAATRAMFSVTCVMRVLYILCQIGCPLALFTH